jgi:hypothetical protein
MRLAALCFAVCFVTGASATSSDSPVVPADEVNSASDGRSGTSLENSNPSSEHGQPTGLTTGPAKIVQHVALSRTELCEAAVAVARANNLPVRFFTRLIQQESGFRPNVVSPVGAQGIAQFMPQTALSRALANPFEPVGALVASAKFLVELADQFGNLGLAAAAYNAGPGRVQEWIAKRKSLPAETKRYVYSITGRAAEAWAAAPKNLSEVNLESEWSCQAAPRPSRHVRVNVEDDQQRLTIRSTVAANPANARLVAMGSLPRPSEFIVGRPVPAAIKAAERRAIKALERRIGSAPNGRPIGSRGSGKGSPEDPW